MLPRETKATGEHDLFRSRLDQILNMQHQLVKLAGTVNWKHLETVCGEVYSDAPKSDVSAKSKNKGGQPPLPTRLMAGFAILKHTFNLSDEELLDGYYFTDDDRVSISMLNHRGGTSRFLTGTFTWSWIPCTGNDTMNHSPSDQPPLSGARVISGPSRSRPRRLDSRKAEKPSLADCLARCRYQRNGMSAGPRTADTNWSERRFGSSG